MTNTIKYSIAVCILLVCVGFLYRQLFLAPEAVSVSENVFPDKIGEWTAKEVTYDKEMLGVLSMDRTVYKSYYKKGSPSVTLFMAYYQTLEKADLSHSPVVCFTGQGWRMISSGRNDIQLNLPGTPSITVNQMVQDKLNTTLITLFWYQSADRSYVNRGIQKLSLFFNRLSGQRENNAFVRLTAVAKKDESINEAKAGLYRFAIDFYPELSKFFL